MPTVNIRVSLSDDLAAFVNDAVRDGVFESADHLFAHAVALIRTQTALGNAPTASPPSPAVQPQVDLTRHAFDGPAYMADLVDMIERRRVDEKKTK